MIRVTSQFYFTYSGEDFGVLRDIFNEFTARTSNSSITIRCNNLRVSEDGWHFLGYDESYYIIADMVIFIDESFYCIGYDEHEIKSFVKALLQYNLTDYGLTYSHMEDVHTEAIFEEGKKRNTSYDHLCNDNFESKPINVKTPAKKNKNFEEKMGSKRRIFILDGDDK